VDGRPLDFRVEQTLDLNADYRLPCQFHWPTAQPAMQIFVSRRRNRICKSISGEKRRKESRGCVRLLDSTRVRNPPRFMNHDRSGYGPAFVPRKRCKIRGDRVSLLYKLFNRIGCAEWIYRSTRLFMKLSRISFGMAAHQSPEFCILSSTRGFRNFNFNGISVARALIKILQKR
jgi:hypothetical protein